MASPPWVTLGDPDRGRALYLEGRRADGSALEALRPGLPTMRGAAAACVQCHRHSGLGDQEGRLRVPPITAASLFGPGRSWMVGRVPPGVQRERSRAETRPPYTVETFVRAMAHGIDGAGQPLDPWMPRYALDAPAVADLLAWLAQLGPVGAQRVRGLDGQVLHIASVVTPEATPARRAALDSVMPAWAQAQRFGPVRVAWHRWALEGGADDWPAQLRGLLAAQPVFAVVAGAGGAEWAPVDAFCEAQALPCVFPMIDRVPPAPAWRFYAAYLSEGAQAEGRLAVRALQTLQRAPAGVQVWIDSLDGEDALRAVQAALDRDAGTEAASQMRRNLSVWDRRLARGSLPAIGPDDLVLSWLSPEALPATLDGLGPERRPRALWLSMQASPPERVETGLAANPAWQSDWRTRVSWLSLRAAPARSDAAAALGLVPWLRGLGLPAEAAGIEAADLFAATFFFSDALQLTRGAWSPAHLMERLEVTVNNRPASGAYVRLSLGPGQRIAAQMGQVLGYTPPDYRRLVPVSAVLNTND